MGGMVSVQHLDLYYRIQETLKDISLDVAPNSITAITGPSGCGKTIFLRTLNRMIDLMPQMKVLGKVIINGKDIYAPDTDVILLRKSVGMVFDRPNPFPMTVFENIAFALRINGEKNKMRLKEIVERSLIKVALWDEIKDSLYKSALELTGEQQQRLCMARLLALEPEILLMDEPTFSLDPVSSIKIEQLICDLKEEYTIIIATQNMYQASRISDQTAFFLKGVLIEADDTRVLFTRPAEKETEDYISGHYG